MAEFVRAQIFGTTFEITSRYNPPHVQVPATLFVCLTLLSADIPICSPLVWAPSDWCGESYAFTRSIACLPNMLLAQLCQRSAHAAKCCGQEDYETFQHPGPVEADLSRAEAAQAYKARECMSTALTDRRQS